MPGGDRHLEGELPQHLPVRHPVRAPHLHHPVRLDLQPGAHRERERGRHLHRGRPGTRGGPVPGSGFENFLATRYTVSERATSFVVALLLFVPPTVVGLARVTGGMLGAVLLAAHLRRYAAENAIDVRAQLTRSD